MNINREVRTPRRALLLAATLAAVTALPAQGIGGGLEVRDEAASMEDKLGAILPLDLEFTDERGYPLKMMQFFPGSRPVLLQIGYYACPGVCRSVMTSMVESLNEIDLEPGQDYSILSVSIDPSEKPELAKQKKDAYLAAFTKIDAANSWYFAVGDQPMIDALTETVGFRYYWAEHDSRFNHPPALIFLSPKGKVTRVLTGIAFDPDDVRLALVEASEGKVGTFWDQIRLNCLTFDPTEGTYSIEAFTVMRIGGAITVVILIAMVILLLRRERRRAAARLPLPLNPAPESSS